MPEEQLGAVYGSGDGILALVNYAKESTSGTAVTDLNPPFSSIFVTRNQNFAFCRQPGFACAHGGQSGSRPVVLRSACPASTASA